MIPTSGTMTKVVRDPSGLIFQPNTEYEWMVGHYVEGEARPLGSLGLILSEKFRFRTVELPPSPAAAAGGVRHGWFGETRTRRR